MRLGGTVVDPERAHFVQVLRQREVGRDAVASAQLHCPVDDPVDRLRAEHLGHGGELRPSPDVLVQQRCSALDQRPAGLDVDLGLGEQLLSEPLLLERPPEEAALVSPVQGDVLSANGQPEPAHTVRQPRRAQSYLGVFKPAVRFPENCRVRYFHVAQLHMGVAAVDDAIHSVNLTGDLHTGGVHRD